MGMMDIQMALIFLHLLMNFFFICGLRLDILCSSFPFPQLFESSFLTHAYCVFLPCLSLAQPLLGSCSFTAPLCASLSYRPLKKVVGL